MTTNLWTSIPLENRSVNQLRFDFSFGIEFCDEFGQISIRINTIFVIKGPYGTAELDPEKIYNCGLALRLFNILVISARAFKDGRLEIAFADGQLLRVDASSQFEAWEIVFSDGARFVSIPGGEVVFWNPDTSE